MNHIVRSGLWGLVIYAMAMAGCRGHEAAPAPAAPPAKVDHAVKEADLNTVTLTSEAETRLGIQLEELKVRPVAAVRVVGGEVIVPPGMTVDVTAPVAGTLQVGRDGAPRAGAMVRRGQPLFRLTPLLTQDRDVRIIAERDAAVAAATLAAAEKKAARADQLVRDGAGSRRSLEEAQAELATARAASDAAKERLAAVNRTPLSGSNELIVSAPMDGVLEAVDAAAGQTVAANAKLIQIARLERLWVRAPIYAGDRRDIDLTRDARILRLDEREGAAGVPARRVQAPPSANPAASAVDVIFELPPGASGFQPGERVLVRLTGRGETSALAVPESALLHDIHGGVWVYVRTAPHVYARRRVEVRHSAGGLAVLARGPSPGTPIVTVGAAELYGVEFGTGK